MPTPRSATSSGADPLGPPLLLTVPQVVALTNLGHTTVEALIASGELRSLKVGRARRCPREAVEEFIAARLEVA